MKRSKRFLSLLLAVMVLLTTVASATFVSASAAGIDNSALVSEYYATNPGGQVGKQGSITIDGDFSDWDTSMLIAKGAAWDVANHYKGAHENCLLDTTALFAAWDSQNLYVAWQMVNTTDTWHREGDGSLSDGGRVLDVPLILALRVDPSKTPMSNRNDASGPIWGQKMGLTFETEVDHLLYMSGKPGLGEPALFTAVDESGNTNYTTGCKLFKTAGIEYKMAEGNIMDTIMGLDYSDDPSDVTNPDANWVDYKTFSGSMGTHNTKYDSFYEIKIPLSLLGIDANYLTTNGVGAMVVATRGESGLDCIPFDTTMLDNVMDDYGADASTSHEKDDEDVITVPLARIGKGGGGVITPPVTQPATQAPATTVAPVTTTPDPIVTDAPATTQAPVVTTAPDKTEVPDIAPPTEAPATTVAPVVTEPTEAPATSAPAATEPTEAPATTVAPTTPDETPATSQAPSVPVILPPGFTTPTETAGNTDASETTGTQNNTNSTTFPVITPPGVSEEVILGDADLNETVSIKDATLIQKYLAKLADLDDKAQFASDADQNENLNIKDVTVIQKFLAKIAVNTPVGEKITYGDVITVVPTDAPVATTATPAASVDETTVPEINVTTSATEATATPEEIPVTTAAPETTAAPATQAPETTAAPTVTEPTEAPATEAPVVTEPTEVPTEAPVVTDAPVVTEPVYTDPVYTEPVYTDPVYTEPDYPDDPAGDTITVYFENNGGWGSVYWHAWSDMGPTNSLWPGDPMESVGGNVYKATISAYSIGIVFNDGQAEGGAKTDDIPVSSGNNNMIYKNGGWTDYNGGNDGPINPPIGDGRTVYFSNNKFWSSVSIYCWNDGGGKNGEWPGQSMTLVGQNEHGEDIYSYTVSSEFNKIIFSGDGAQTIDIDLGTVTDNGFYTDGEYDGKLGVGTYNYVG